MSDTEGQNKYDQGVDTHMTTRVAALAVSLSALLGVSMLGHSPAQAATRTAIARVSTASSKNTSRRCRRTIRKRRPSRVARATPRTVSSCRYPTASGAPFGTVSPYRLIVADPKEGSVGFFIKGDENGVDRARRHATQSREAGNHRDRELRRAPHRTPSVARAAALLGPEILGDTTRKQFVTAMPPDKRRSREAALGDREQLLHGAGEQPRGQGAEFCGRLSAHRERLADHPPSGRRGREARAR